MVNRNDEKLRVFLDKLGGSNPEVIHRLKDALLICRFFLSSAATILKSYVRKDDLSDGYRKHVDIKTEKNCRQIRLLT